MERHDFLGGASPVAVALSGSVTQLGATKHTSVCGDAGIQNELLLPEGQRGDDITNKVPQRTELCRTNVRDPRMYDTQHTSAKSVQAPQRNL
eukprot:4149613-Prymnesium_polylepis.1